MCLDGRIYRIYTGLVSDDIYDRLARCDGFDWDDGNAPKVTRRHAVEPGECEQACFSEPFVVLADPKHSQREERWRALGTTLRGRKLYLVLTIRREMFIRVIAARDMNRKERTCMTKPKRALKKIPTFESEDDERAFWMTHDSTEYVNWSTARVVRFPNLRPTSTAISVRLPETLLTELKLLANERDVPYQSLLKVYLDDRVRAERRRRQRTKA